MLKFKSIFVVLLVLFTFSSVFSQSHPNLILTKKGVSAIKRDLDKNEILSNSFNDIVMEVNIDMANGIDVPIPIDMAGGYTHERHKKNYLIMQKAGTVYQITGQAKYAAFIRDMLYTYAKIYKQLPPHPTKRSYSPGKIFWQCLNDANWLVYTSQAYDCIYTFLKPEERKYLSEELFRPFADYLSIISPQFFNRIHNHSTWGIAGVGMIGMVMNDKELIDRALNGLKEDNIDPNQKDNDGGLIKLPGQTNTGFFVQLDYLFSPDGYYTEGPYYQRYALAPIMLFAAAIQNNLPELKIFEYRDNILKKSLYAILNLTDKNGQFFPINDAQKGMSFLSRELVSSVGIIYHFCGNDPELLSISKLQGKVMPDDMGHSVASGLAAKKENPLTKSSVELRDGKDGNEGAVGILRSKKLNDELALVMKYSAQGMGHGHYDKLSFSLYNNEFEVLQDYGLARYVNIDQKYGGAYLPENTSWAKQSIAHNTLVVNQKSHFNGDFETGNKYHSMPYFFDASNKSIQIMSAIDTNAYQGIKMQRTMAVINNELLEYPFIIDVFKVKSAKNNQYDLPFHFLGQIMSANFKYSVPKTLSALGDSNGYQHLWKTGEGKTDSNNAKLSWFSNQRFYTLTTAVSADDELLFTRLGANDPNFNLRSDQAFILRRNNANNTTFASIIETHGHYDPVNEIATNSYSSIKSLQIIHESDNYTAVSFTENSGNKWILILADNNSLKETIHNLDLNGQKCNWTGPFKLFKTK